jgi:hypothetical protein
MSNVDLTALAAFTAAGLSLANVTVSYRLSRRGDLERWRREQELPIVARILSLSSEALREWSEALAAKMNWADYRKDPEAQKEADASHGLAVEHWRKGSELLDALNYEAAQLDILASQQVRVQAHKLVDAHTRGRFDMNPAGGRLDLWERGPHPGASERALIEAARSDLGITEPAEPARSLIGMVIQRLT